MPTRLRPNWSGTDLARGLDRTAIREYEHNYMGTYQRQLTTVFGSNVSRSQRYFTEVIAGRMMASPMNGTFPAPYGGPHGLIVETYRRHEYRADSLEVRVRWNGENGLGKNTSRALTDLLQSLTDMHERTPDRIRDDFKELVDGIEYAIGRGIDLEAMATDKCWPLFWEALVISRFGDQAPRGYARETAGEAIKQFRQDHELSRNAWKDLTKMSHVRLFYGHKHSLAWDIKYPDHICAHGVGGRLTLRNGPLNEWLKIMFNDRRAGYVSGQQFYSLLMDAVDSLRFGEAFIAALMRCEDWQAVRTLIGRFEGYRYRDNENLFFDAAHRYINPPTIYGEGPATATQVLQSQMALNQRMQEAMQNLVREGNAILYGDGRGAPASKQRPEKPIVYEGTEKMPEEVKLGPLTATLIADNQALFDEGETMKHCVWDLYSNKVLAGDYLVYHIDGPGLPKRGFTAGFRFEQKGSIQDIVCYGGPPVEIAAQKAAWKFDQIRGSCNAQTQDPAVMALVAMIEEEISEVMP